jgi:hypothetical protein
VPTLAREVEFRIESGAFIIGIKDVLDFDVAVLALAFALGDRPEYGAQPRVTADFIFEYLVNVSDEASTISFVVGAGLIRTKLTNLLSVRTATELVGLCEYSIRIKQRLSAQTSS